ncbi:IS30 family transposase [Planctomicrobium sp. SH664]|uniref:IS30 family transposase n=1 Tax=Planctomicrobium sp. SH664 TaxID=3448125 RepID=UPI003F5C8726
MKKSYCHLSLDERRTIFKLLEAGKSKAEIAGILGRHRSTLFREVRRNSFYHEDHFNNGYFHVNAHDMAAARRAKLCKLLRQPQLRDYIIQRLRDLWSPDQIAGHLRRLGFPDFYASHETIYAFIYSAEGRALNLYRYLKRCFKNRRKRFRRQPRWHRGIPEHMGISHRPAIVKDRNDFGHWEGDLIIFRKDYGEANITCLVERKSRYCVLIKNPHRKSMTVMGQIRDHLSALPRHSRQTITFDRGPEFSAWGMLERHVEHGSYYCDPQAPWQKGTNENTNGRLRRYLPGDTNVNELSAADLRAISQHVNHTPRKCLDYRTPHEVFYNHVHQHQDLASCLR